MRGNNNRFFYEVDCSKDSAMAIAISTVFKTLIGKHEGFKQLMKSVFADYKVKLFSTAHLICEVRYPPPEAWRDGPGSPRSLQRRNRIRRPAGLSLLHRRGRARGGVQRRLLPREGLLGATRLPHIDG